jgi:hypothetical protein
MTTALTISSATLRANTERLNPLKPNDRLKPSVPVRLVTLAGLILFLAPRRRSLAKLLTLVLALTTLGVLSGCGSGAVDPNGPGPGTLSAGSYAVTITATGASTIQTTTVNLTIQ